MYGKFRARVASPQIELKSDKTFAYYAFMTPANIYFVKEGTWNKISKDTIVLNTYIQPEILKTTYKGKVNKDLVGKVRIKISDKDGTLGYANVQINDKELSAWADTNGMVEFETRTLKNIHYNFFNSSETIAIENPNYNDIEVLIKDLKLSEMNVFLTDYKIVIKRNKIIMDSGKVYKKTNLRNKWWTELIEITKQNKY